MGYVVKLGTVSASRNYALKPQGDGIAWSRGPANPFAAKVDVSNPYDKVDAWNEWVQEDWQTGVARVDPESGGFLYAEAETRVPKQIILPPLMRMQSTRVVDGTKADCRNMPTSAAGTVTVGAGGFAKVAMTFTTPATLPGTFSAYYFYARVASGVSCTISTYTNVAGAPSVLIGSSTFSGITTDRNFYWYGRGIDYGTVTTATQYWVVIEPTSAADSIEVAYSTSGYDTVGQSYNGSAWAAITGKYLIFATTLHRIYAANGLERGMIRFNSNFYTWQNEELYKHDAVNLNFDVVGTITGAGNITSAAVYGPTLFFGRSSGNYTTMSTAEAFTAAATTATLFLEYKGFLYRSYQNDLYWSVDGSTWSSAYQVGGDDVEIRGMAGMGDSLYMATDKALYRFAPGNIVEETSRFGSEDSTNGVGMLEYQGRLYIPAGGRLFRFDPSGQMQDIWVSREDDLPSSRIGIVASLTRMNNWLVALVMPASSGGFPSLWIWQEEGWHFLANTMQNHSALLTDRYSVLYDRENSRLWFTTPIANFHFELDDYTLNPYNSGSSLYQPYGWLEQDRFYGGQHLLNKDFESVTIVADNLSTNVNVKVYFQDEGSTAWESLGTATSDSQELRWSTHSTRPQGKWIKLGLLLQTNSGTETPRVRAVVVKFMPMVNERIRDSMTLMLKDYIQMPDGDPDDYTRAQQLTHVQSMIASVIPIIYTDPLGVQYEAKITDYSMNIPDFAYENSANVVKEMDIMLVVEQVPSTTYTPP
jgi:hypothetical protein